MSTSTTTKKKAAAFKRLPVVRAAQIVPGVYLLDKNELWWVDSCMVATADAPNGMAAQVVLEHAARMRPARGGRLEPDCTMSSRREIIAAKMRLVVPEGSA